MLFRQIDLWTQQEELPVRSAPPEQPRPRRASNPFRLLLPVLALIAEEARVLPATGQAMEDLVRPDHDEVIDQLRNGDQRVLGDRLEYPNQSSYVNLRPLHRTERHLFRYFLDGSARTFFLGDVVEGHRRSSVHVSQIGVAAIYRKNDGRVRVGASCHKIVLMMNKKELSFGDRIQTAIERAGPHFAFHDCNERDGETERTSPGKDSRSRAPIRHIT
jgi:hypothetical protein